MRNFLIAALVLGVAVTMAFGQPAKPAPAVPAPPTVAPPVPLPAPTAPGPASPAQELALRSPEVAWLLSLPRLLGKPLTFLVAFLFVGLVFGLLVRRAISPRPGGEAHYSDALDDRTRRRLAIGNLVVWTVALLAGCEAAGLQWFTSLLQMVLEFVKGLFGLIGAIIGGLFWVIAAMVIAYALSPRGQDLVLGLLGWAWLRHSGSKPKPDQEFDLGGGARGRITSTDFLHSTLQTTDGRTQTVPNAWLMRTYFNWDRLTWGATEAPPKPPVPPPPGSV
ncbi:mechanosensitive ion channel family protein [bacterium]|nr:mechanosensitive ion channel family protein [bacterium]